MKFAAVISLLGLLTITQTPLGQLLKLPVLIQHYCAHKKQGDISLLRFLKDHYSTRHNDADRSQDERLPFRTVLIQSIGFAVVPTLVKTDLSLNVDAPEKIALDRLYVPQQHLSRIFHPPRT